MAESAAAPSEQITIKVSLNGDETSFKVRKSTPFAKVWKAFCDKKGIARNTLRFVFEGNTIADDSSPKMLEMKEGAQIDAMIEQVGGGAAL